MLILLGIIRRKTSRSGPPPSSPIDYLLDSEGLGLGSGPLFDLVE